MAMTLRALLLLAALVAWALPPCHAGARDVSGSDSPGAPPAPETEPEPEPADLEIECHVAAVVHDHEAGFSTNSYTCDDLSAATHVQYDLDVESSLGWHLRTGDLAMVRGSKMGGKGFKVKSFVHHGTGNRREAAYLGTRTAAVLMLRFVDSNGNAYPSTYTREARKSTAKTANETVFGVFDSSIRKTHAGTWAECSYGKLKLGYDVDSKGNDFLGDYPGAYNGADIFYVDVPYTCRAGVGSCTSTYSTGSSCTSSEYYGWTGAAKSILDARGVDRSKWQHWLVIYPTGPGVACNFIGMGNVGCSSTYCFAWIPASYAGNHQDITHEMGHNLHLAHSGVLGASGNAAEYGDLSGTMGFCCSVRCFNAPHAYELGWLSPSASLSGGNLPGYSPLTTTLRSMSRFDNGLIKISLDWTSSATQTYWLQLKTSWGYDKFMDASWRGNVQVKRWSMAAYEQTYHIATLGTGDTWRDPTGTLVVRVNSIDATNAHSSSVTITRAQGSSPPVTPPPSPCAGVTCNAPPPCKVGPGTCNTADGSCSYGAAVVCDSPPDDCHAATGRCNPITYRCQYKVLARCEKDMLSRITTIGETNSLAEVGGVAQTADPRVDKVLVLSTATAACVGLLLVVAVALLIQRWRRPTDPSVMKGVRIVRAGECQVEMVISRPQSAGGEAIESRVQSADDSWSALNVPFVAPPANTILMEASLMPFVSEPFEPTSQPSSRREEH